MPQATAMPMGGAVQPQPPQQELTLAQIAANQSAAKAAPKPRKTPAKKDPNAPPKPKATPKPKAPPKSKAPPKTAAAAAAGVPVGAAPVAAPGRPLPLRQRPPGEIVLELRGNLDLIRREYAENMSMAAKQGKEYYPPAWEVKSQFDAAVVGPHSLHSRGVRLFTRTVLAGVSATLF